MKARIDQAVLATAAADVARILPGRALHPVMLGIRVDAGDRALTLSAFDYERSLTVTVDADIAEPGTLLLPGRALAGLVTGLIGDVDLQDDGQRAVLAAGRSRITLPVGPLDQYPALPEPGETGVTVDAEALRDALAAVTWSCAADGEGAPVLRHVSLEAEDDDLTVVASDRYTLSVRHVLADVDEPFTALPVPRDLADALRGVAGNVQLGVAGGVLTVQGQRRTATMRCSAEDFVAWPRLIPSDTRQAVVDRDQLLDAATISLRADDRPGSPIVLTVVVDGFDYEGGGRGEADANEVAGHVDADIAEGTALTFACKPAFLVAALKALQPGPVRLALRDSPRQPFLVEQDDVDGLHLIMPIALT